MDLDLFVQCAAKITAMDGVSFQGLIVLMFFFVLLNSNTSLSTFVSEIVGLKSWRKKKQYQLKTVWY